MTIWNLKQLEHEGEDEKPAISSNFPTELSVCLV